MKDKNRLYKPGEIYFGYEVGESYNIDLEDYDLVSDYSLFEIKKYKFEIDEEESIRVFKNLMTDEIIYLKTENNEVIHKKPYHMINHYVENMISIEELIEEYDYIDYSSDYEEYYYEKILNNLRDKESFTKEELYENFQNICDLVVYLCNVIEDRELLEEKMKKEKKTKPKQKIIYFPNINKR